MDVVHPSTNMAQIFHGLALGLVLKCQQHWMKEYLFHVGTRCPEKPAFNSHVQHTQWRSERPLFRILNAGKRNSTTLQLPACSSPLVYECPPWQPHKAWQKISFLLGCLEPGKHSSRLPGLQRPSATCRSHSSDPGPHFKPVHQRPDKPSLMFAIPPDSGLVFRQHMRRRPTPKLSTGSEQPVVFYISMSISFNQAETQSSSLLPLKLLISILSWQKFLSSEHKFALESRDAWIVRLKSPGFAMTPSHSMYLTI